MTKRDYQRLALAMRSARDDLEATDKQSLYQSIADQLALAFTEDNAKFDYAKWMDACEIADVSKAERNAYGTS